jgi:hypothetical protein
MGEKSFLVHQPGKVASQTVEAAIRSCLPPGATLSRDHYLSDEGLGRLLELCKLPGADPQLEQSVRFQFEQAKESRARYLDLKAENLWLVTGVREPVAQIISGVFQNLDVYCPDIALAEGDEGARAGALADFINEKFKQMRAGVPANNFGEGLMRLKLQGQENWFEEEFKETYGIDVTRLDMSRSQTFVTFTHRNLSVLLYRTERLLDGIPDLLAAMGLKNDTAPAYVNRGAEKSYARLYAAFKCLFVPTEAMLDYYKRGPFGRTFYPD